MIVDINERGMTMGKMNHVEVRAREGYEKLYQIDQLYVAINEDYDIHINGSIQMIGMKTEDVKKVKVYANLCNQEGKILYVLNNWKNYPVKEEAYNSFSLYCSTISRFFNPEELSYVEIYLSFNERD